MKQNRKALLAEGEKATIVTTSFNIFLIILKITSGLFVGSIALLASGLDALKDLITSLAVFIGLRFSKKDPSKRFPYGYYRLETLATLIVSIFILLLGLDVLIESFHTILNPGTLNYPIVGLIVSLISILLAYTLYHYNIRIGEKINSNALIISAKEFQLDVFTNFLVFLGILSHIISFPQLEGIIGLIISFFIFKTGLKFGSVSLLTLLDAIDDPGVIDQIKSIVKDFPSIEEISNIRIRRSGPFYLADIEIKMQAKETLKKLSEVTHQLEMALKQKISQLDSIMISVTPIIKKILKVAIPVNSLNVTLDDLPSEHFGIAKAFFIVELDIPNQKILSTSILENPYEDVERKRGLLCAELLADKNIDIITVKSLDKFGVGPKAIFSENHVQLFEFQSLTIKEILNEILRTQLNSFENLN
ncbi:MAG: cation diffusion facilitator family transporter [Candidatus Hodarchaeales archaeon]